MAESNPIPLAPSVTPIQLSFALPKAPQTKVHLHLTIRAKSLLLFLTTVADGNTSATASLGSFVYALPDVSPLIFQVYPIAFPILLVYFWFLGFLFLLLVLVLVLTTLATATQSISSAVNTNLYVRILHRVHYADGEVAGEENSDAGVCGEFNELCECRVGRDGGGGDRRVPPGGGGCNGGGGEGEGKEGSEQWKERGYSQWY